MLFIQKILVILKSSGRYINMKKTLVLGDLGHTTKILASNFVPLNIGLIASYLKSFYDKEWNIVLFKNPQKLINYIKNNKTNVMALSNYCWNYSLSKYVLRSYRQIYPGGITVFGGPNIPKEKPRIHALLSKNKFIDFIIEGEGEASFYNIIQRISSCNFSLNKSKTKPISGVYFINANNELINSSQPLLENLDNIPSPYLSGLLDEFLLNDLVGFDLLPMIEVTRGCPFSCTFCRNGDPYYSKIRSHSTNRIMQEIDYITSLLKKNQKQKLALLITDQNFGSRKEDVLIAEKLGKTYKKFGFPLYVIATTGKYNADTVLEMISKYRGISMTLAIQSSDKTVLKNIKRQNFPVEKFLKLQRQLKKQKRLSKSDVILGLPGDTREKHLNTLRTLLNIGIDIVDTFSFIMLLGTQEDSLDSRRKHGYKTKWRLLPGGFSRINGEKIFECEEIVVSTNTLAFDDYLYLRRIHLLLATVCNGTLFKEIKKIILERKLDIVDFLIKLELLITKTKDKNIILKILDEFSLKAKNELFDSREEIEKHYSQEENYQKLVFDKAGENLLQKFRLKMLSNLQELSKMIKKTFFDYMRESNCSIPEQDSTLFRVIDIKCEYMGKLLKGLLFSKEQAKKIILNYDVFTWINNDTKKLKFYRLRQPKEYIAKYSEKQLKEFQLFIRNPNLKKYERAKTIYRLGIERMIPVFHVRQ